MESESQTPEKPEQPEKELETEIMPDASLASNQPAAPTVDHAPPQNQEKLASPPKASPQKLTFRRFFSLQGVKGAFSRLKSGVYYLGMNLFSKDPDSRRISFLFFVSLAGIVTVTTLYSTRLWRAYSLRPSPKKKTEESKMIEAVRKEAEEAKRKGNAFNIGTYKIQFSPVTEKLLPGETNMALVDIVVLCDSVQTREFLEPRIVQIRNQIYNALTPIDREEFVSKDGKRKLKALLIKKINELIPHGKIDDVYFSKLLMN